jgi:thiol:disulfide interchange protein
MKLLPQVHLPKSGAVLVALAVMFLSIAVHAAPVNSGNVEAELISEVSSIKAGESFWVALRQEIRPGWHTYWRNPGDSGAPTELHWELPSGFSASDIHWPYPERVPYGPLMNFGYHGTVIFPVQITVPDSISTGEVTLRAKGEWLVCADICIPEDADLELKILVSGGESVVDDDNIEAFRSARQRLPKEISTTASYTSVAESITLSVAMSGLSESRLESIDFFPYEEGVLDFPAPQTLSMTTSGFQLVLKPGYAFKPESSSLDGILVVTEDAGSTLQTAFTVQPSGSGSGSGSRAEAEGISMGVALLFAFLGGLILNLMPCVFPVLSIKILSLVAGTHSDRRVMRIHGLVYLAGVVLSFVAIAAVLIGLRAGGEEIGWGFQLQSPIVVGLLAYLFVVIGLNLSGYFEFGLSFMGAGENLTNSGGYASSFYTGVLAAVVAAPCTAPFMGAAIGYALTLDAFLAILIFASLGLGMAVPYLILCFAPFLLDKLPKPGAWMETLKELFAFPMYATAIWLIWVLNQQTGADGLLAILVGMLCIGFTLWLLKNPGVGITRVFKYLAGAALVISALMLAGLNETMTTSTTSTAASSAEHSSVGLKSEPYSPERLKALIADGPVFVNFTAAWCITCKVNDIAALSSDKIEAVFKDNGVSYVVGDWTNEDPTITRALSEYGRSGVPLYLLYRKGASKAEVLPQILTESIVIGAIENLGSELESE